MKYIRAKLYDYMYFNNNKHFVDWDEIKFQPA